MTPESSARVTQPRSDRPNTLLVLALVECARQRGLPYAYLGYWIAESRKMTYKARFRPLEGLGPTGWQKLAL